MSHADKGWTTQSELAFIAGLGEWSDLTKDRGGRLAALSGYLRSIELRHHWGNISRPIVLKAALSAMLRVGVTT